MHPEPASRGIRRRDFLRTSSLALAAPLVARAQAPASRDLVQVGFMGLNSRGSDLLKDFLASRRVRVTWLCDVDRRAIDKAQLIVKASQGEPVKTTDDFRRMLEDRDLDAVVMATPDHWHATATLQAAQAGKHVYVEKPLSHNAREGEWIIEAARRHRTVVQVGLQRRSVAWVQEAIQRIHAGELGPVHFARAWYAAKRDGIGKGQPAPVPDWLNYSLWQGPAPERPFRDNVVHYNWHWFWHWGTGELANNGVHFLDIARWGLRASCPSRVTSLGGRYYFDDDQETPDTQVVTYDFGHCTLTWEHRSCQPQGIDGEIAGVTFYGTQGSLVLGLGGYRILDRNGRELSRVEKPTPTAPHVANFLDCIIDRSHVPAAGPEDGHHSTLLCHLGNIAQRAGDVLEVNPATAQLRNSRMASRYWGREYRKGWTPRV